MAHIFCQIKTSTSVVLVEIQQNKTLPGVGKGGIPLPSPPLQSLLSQYGGSLQLVFGTTGSQRAVLPIRGGSLDGRKKDSRLTDTIHN